MSFEMNDIDQCDEYVYVCVNALHLIVFAYIYSFIHYQFSEAATVYSVNGQEKFDRFNVIRGRHKWSSGKVCFILRREKVRTPSGPTLLFIFIWGAREIQKLWHQYFDTTTFMRMFVTITIIIIKIASRFIKWMRKPDKK